VCMSVCMGIASISVCVCDPGIPYKDGKMRILVFAGKFFWSHHKEIIDVLFKM